MKFTETLKPSFQTMSENVDEHLTYIRTPDNGDTVFGTVRQLGDLIVMAHVKYAFCCITLQVELLAWLVYITLYKIP